jgi:hypothetical protein
MGAIGGPDYNAVADILERIDADVGSWPYKHVERKGQHVCFITKEDIDSEGAFTTGLTVNMILLSHLKTGISASEYAKRFIDTATREAGASKELVVNPRPIQGTRLHHPRRFPGNRRSSYTT